MNTPKHTRKRLMSCLSALLMACFTVTATQAYTQTATGGSVGDARQVRDNSITMYNAADDMLHATIVGGTLDDQRVKRDFAIVESSLNSIQQVVASHQDSSSYWWSALSKDLSYIPDTTTGPLKEAITNSDTAHVAKYALYAMSDAHTLRFETRWMEWNMQDGHLRDNDSTEYAGKSAMTGAQLHALDSDIVNTNRAANAICDSFGTAYPPAPVNRGVLSSRLATLRQTIPAMQEAVDNYVPSRTNVVVREHWQSMGISAAKCSMNLNILNRLADKSNLTPSENNSISEAALHIAEEMWQLDNDRWVVQHGEEPSGHEYRPPLGPGG